MKEVSDNGLEAVENPTQWVKYWSLLADMLSSGDVSGDVQPASGDTLSVSAVLDGAPQFTPACLGGTGGPPVSGPGHENCGGEGGGSMTA